VFEVDLPAFEAMVAEAVEGLPEEFRERLQNLEFAVEERARPDDYARASEPVRGTLLGVYRGVPLPRRGQGYHMALPDRIVVFRAPLQQLARDEADLRARVRHVVRHEVAHHFGISDARLREIDAY